MRTRWLLSSRQETMKMPRDYRELFKTDRIWSRAIGLMFSLRFPRSLADSTCSIRQLANSNQARCNLLISTFRPICSHLSFRRRSAFILKGLFRQPIPIKQTVFTGSHKPNIIIHHTSWTSIRKRPQDSGRLNHSSAWIRGQISSLFRILKLIRWELTPFSPTKWPARLRFTYVRKCTQLQKKLSVLNRATTCRLKCPSRTQTKTMKATKLELRILGKWWILHKQTDEAIFLSRWWASADSVWNSRSNSTPALSRCCICSTCSACKSSKLLRARLQSTAGTTVAAPLPNRRVLIRVNAHFISFLKIHCLRLMGRHQPCTQVANFSSKLSTILILKSLIANR